MILDSSHATPLYTQLENYILENIRNGIYKPMQKIPSEADFSKEFEVSRITVRKAISNLTDQGILIRHQGKGTFVSEMNVNKNYESLFGYGRSMEAQGKKPKRKILQIEYMTECLTGIKEALELSKESRMIHLKRLLYSGDEVATLEDSFYPPSFTFLFSADLEHESTYELITKQTGLIPYRSERTISIIYADETIAEVFGGKEGDAHLLLSEIVYNKDDIPIHVSKEVINQKTSLHLSAKAANLTGKDGI